MKLPRLSIKQLMIAVVVAALNFAAVSAINATADVVVVTETGQHVLKLNYGRCAPLPLIGIAPAALALQLAVLAIFLTRGRARAFWTGFALAGTLALASFIWAQAFPKFGRVFNPMTVTLSDESIRGSQMAAIWSAYEEALEGGLSRIGWLRRIDPRKDLLATNVVRGFGWTAPQWIIGLGGGLVAMLLASRWTSQRQELGRQATSRPPASLAERVLA